MLREGTRCGIHGDSTTSGRCGSCDRKALIDKGVPMEELVEILANGGYAWSTEELKVDFTVIGFLAPYVEVRRKSDGQRGTLMFTHRPRYYFGFEAVA